MAHEQTWALANTPEPSQPGLFRLLHLVSQSGVIFLPLGAPSVAAAPYVGRDARDCLLTRFDTLWRVKLSDPSSVVLPIEPVSLSQRVSHRTSFRDTFGTD